MKNSVKVLNRLKKATNYTKLALHKDGPKSYTKGQGAMLKVLYKFGDGKLSKKKLKEILGWHGCETGKVAKKAQHNGYVTIRDPKGKFVVALTDKGQEVVQKRLAAEDRVADEILSMLTDKEVKQLYKITGKIIETCQEMGVDYSLIKKRPHYHGDYHGPCGPEGVDHHHHGTDEGHGCEGDHPEDHCHPEHPGGWHHHEHTHHDESGEYTHDHWHSHEHGEDHDHEHIPEE